MSPYSKAEVGHAVETAAASVRARDPGELAASVRILLTDDNWMRYVDPADRQEHSWQDFREFVERRLETTVEALVGALSASPSLAATVADLAIASPGGHPTRGISMPPGRKPQKALWMRRLLKERSDLAERVERGEMTVAAAAREAGWLQRHVQVPADPEGFVLAGIRLFGRDTMVRLSAEVQPRTRACVICGTDFVLTRHHQLTCGPEHGREHARRYSVEKGREKRRKAKERSEPPPSEVT